MIIQDRTVITWISAAGEILPLSGVHRDGDTGVWLGGEPKNLGVVETKAIFDAAARQKGETWVGETMDHAEIDLPLFILADNSVDLRLRREHLKRVMRSDEIGWLAVASSVTGWRTVAARRGEMVPLFTKDLPNGTGLRVDVVLLVDAPLSRTPDHAPRWRNTAGTGTGSLWLDPGPDQESWPEFTFVGPGRPRLRYADVDFDLGFSVLAGEKVLIVTDQARPTVRGITAAGERRNLMPLLKGRKFSAPLPRDQITRLDVTVTGGSPQSELLAVVPQHHEGLL